MASVGEKRFVKTTAIEHIEEPVNHFAIKSFDISSILE
jgi:hypothetical protein